MKIKEFQEKSIKFTKEIETIEKVYFNLYDGKN